MTDPSTLASFEIVRIEDASNALAKRLRVYVALGPEHMSQLHDVAAKVVADHAADNDVVMMFFHPDTASAGKAQAEARAQYVRSGMKQGYIPKPLSGDRRAYERTTRLKMAGGVITVESGPRL